MDTSKIGILDNTINGEDPNVDDYFTFRDLFSTFVSIIQRELLFTLSICRKRGIESIVVTDHDGVIVLKVASSLYGHKPITLSISVLVTFASLVSFCEKVEEFGRVSFVIYWNPASPTWMYTDSNKQGIHVPNKSPPFNRKHSCKSSVRSTSESDSDRPGAPGVGLKLKPSPRLSN
ncbi:putative ragulator complex protein LAMTOR3-A-like isoform X1 [Cryptosporidium canis]|uniref:Ragulator complex protein LAMTOR3-A-like isoform X1 n=1 Tax=Cryptosporidium canis TaxID=195482 RepID=A0A9D5DGV9_9CRYT|nr:putative ragulator complex protein LAMTOR3-A-like isoform X1 [Cryptosporidium canis]